MKIIIVGCGKVGATLAEQLSNEGNDIVIVDKDAEKVQDISNACDIMGVVGSGSSHNVQLEAGIREANLLIAVTGSDELNLLCCLIAKKAGNGCQTIARVRNPEVQSGSPTLSGKSLVWRWSSIRNRRQLPRWQGSYVSHLPSRSRLLQTDTLSFCSSVSGQTLF